MIHADTSVGTHPTIDLGCGNLCTLNYDSVISSVIAVVATLAIADLNKTKECNIAAHVSQPIDCQPPLRALRSHGTPNV